MKEELISFILEHKLSPFAEGKTPLGTIKESIYKTKDAKTIHHKVLTQLSTPFNFKETTNLWHLFPFTEEEQEITKRQEFFKQLKKKKAQYLQQLKKPRKTWKPKYDVIIVTEEETSFLKLKELGCPVQLISTQNDVQELERYDLVQVVDCEQYNMILERLPQTIFLNSVEDAYLERYLEELSGWKENYELLTQEKEHLSEEIKLLLATMEELFLLLEGGSNKALTEKVVEDITEEINEKISKKIKDMTITGEGLLNMLGEGKIPTEILQTIKQAIQESGINENLFNMNIPVTIDYKELEEQIRRQNATEYTDLAQHIKKYANKLKEVPTLLSYLSADLLAEDFCQGIATWITEEKTYPEVTEKIELIDAKNMFLKEPQPISFQLTTKQTCSILTGANSGGKTTLIEHLLQNITLQQLGLPITGTFNSPLFTEVYYFAKNKGSASKGAFETLLTQMATIKPGNKTLILADEIEAVTEPGVAGKIIAATAEYFIQKNCYLILATHLGNEIQKRLPARARIDGIEATGLDENFNLLVNHNPILGKLAHSTPELIVERMANAYKEEYFVFLYQQIKERS